MTHTLPERQEDDGLDGKKLEDRIVRPEKILSGKVEEKQSVQRKTDTDVVHHRNVQITSFSTTTAQQHNGLTRTRLPGLFGAVVAYYIPDSMVLQQTWQHVSK